MAELSVGASVVGILSAAAHVSKKLFDFVQNTREAPKQAHETLREVNDLRMILAQCQTLLSRNEQSQVPGASQILVDDVATVITGCVLSFSQLDRLMAEVETDDQMNVIDRMKWAWREKKLVKITSRLISQKQSLGLMVTILGCTYQADMIQPVSELKSMIQTMLANQNGLSERMRVPESGHTQCSYDVPSDQGNDEVSTIRRQAGTTKQGDPRKPDRGRLSPVPYQGTAESANTEAAYVEELYGSKVYRRALSQSSGISVMSVTTKTTDWSALSGCSLADVSTISNVRLPIQTSDLRKIGIQKTEASTDETRIKTERTHILANLSQQQKKTMLNRLSDIINRDSDIFHHHGDNRYSWKAQLLTQLGAFPELWWQTTRELILPESLKKTVEECVVKLITLIDEVGKTPGLAESLSRPR